MVEELPKDFERCTHTQVYEASSPGEGVVSEDISGCRQEKEERQAEENRLRMKQEEREDATLSRETQGQQEALAENKGE